MNIRQAWRMFLCLKLSINLSIVPARQLCYLRIMHTLEALDEPVEVISNPFQGTVVIESSDSGELRFTNFHLEARPVIILKKSC